MLVQPLQEPPSPTSSLENMKNFLTLILCVWLSRPFLTCFKTMNTTFIHRK